MAEHRHESGGHDPPGRIFVVLEKVADITRLLRGQFGEKPILRLRRELADQVRGVVVRQPVQELRALGGSQGGQEFGSHLAFFHLGERF